MSPPYPMYMPSPAFPYLPPQMYYMPQMQGGPDHPEGGDSAGIGQGCANMEGQVMTPATTQSSIRNIAGMQMKNVAFLGNTNLKTLTTPTTASNPGNPSATIASSPRPGGSTDQTVPTQLHVLGTQQGQTGSREQNRQISLLLAELDAARDLNVKVSSSLVHALFPYEKKNSFGTILDTIIEMCAMISLVHQCVAVIKFL